MRIKMIGMLLALVLFIGVFFVPITAFAAESENTTIPDTTEAQTPDGGNLPDTDFENETSDDTDDTVSAIPDGALTPDGTGTILDYATSEDDKQFYTITTEDGSIFYLIIDGMREENNVYFLNAVTIADLMALAEKTDSGSIGAIPSEASCSCTDKCEAGRINIDCEVCMKDLTACVGKTTQTAEPKDDTEKNSSNTGMIIIIVIAVLAVAGVGCYVKIIRPKKQTKDRYDDDDDGDEYCESFGLTPEYEQSEDLPEDEDDSGEDFEDLDETESEE